MFKVEFSLGSKKFLKKAEKIDAGRIIDKIKELVRDPFPPDAKRGVSKKEQTFRIRVGRFRISYIFL